MQKIIYAAIAICCLTACKNNTSNQVAPTPTQASAPAKEKKTITKMPGAEVSKKFGIDVVEKLTYSGYYEAVVAQNQETLSGKFEIESTEKMEDFDQERIWDFVSAKYTGSYDNGSKEGIFTMESGPNTATITFSKGQCTESTYEGAEEGQCYGFKGKLANCTFGEISKHSKEVDCETRK